MKVLVLGIGNILFGDEGIGVHLCNYLKVNYQFECHENSIEFIDGGTLANTLIPLIVEYDNVLILDCVSVANAKIGEVYSFGFDKVPNFITWAGSAHEVEMLQTLHLTKLMGDLPPVHIIGIVPEIIGEDTAFHLSNSLLEGVVTMESEAIRYLTSLGFTVKKIQDIPLQEVANNSYKGF
ncbi:HyaD/HybD family hydrogenase maturation endopeptidase [Helicobacter sp. MIT 14-3879]|uniref:HyaD/HybD family hydrogenase maturation endopeptidase n=1 Tax=Helicobacter sp. MIT 14-3879 TaxID=2040649 RepID=UPI000E1FABC3|nr:HyaD/HybD family hydrogenase maturation endopeptidase [Helicobacter sp. MIT 14-3879]RDU60896.1 hydrogenase expression/formation protein [Helicobacter sp. MIT 14-3879]